jgi:two-component system response regulator (stage 0 sporulation protein F)
MQDKRTGLVMARILVIDDERDTRQLLRRMLEGVGHDVEEALDGEEGLRQYRVKPSDLVIMDLLMPGLDGLTTINELLREFPDAKIVAVSGGGGRDLDLLPKAKELGAAETFGKPFDVPALLKAVADLLAA